MSTLLVDGDVVVHLACEGRREGLNILDLVKKEFHEEFLKQLNVTDKVLRLITLDDIDFTPEQDAAFMEKAWKRYNEIIDDLVFDIGCKDIRVAMKGHTNFRDEIYPAYKAHRKTAPRKKNEFVPAIRDRAVKEGMATYAINMEADDLLRIWAEELKTDYVIASVDKDLLMIPGRHYRMHKQEHVTMTPEAALKTYYTQLIMGDLTDGIYGVKGIGPVKAEQLLSQVDTETEYQTIVKLAYQRCYGKNWEKELTLNGRLIYLLKHENDIFAYHDWPDVHIDRDTPESVYVRSVVKVTEELTIESALALVDPTATTSSTQWNKAMDFLMRATADMGSVEEEEALTALEVMTTRGKIPESEVIAFKTLKNNFAGIANVAPVRVVVEKAPLAITEIVKPPTPTVAPTTTPVVVNPLAKFALKPSDLEKPKAEPIKVEEKPKFVFKMPGS